MQFYWIWTECHIRIQIPNEGYEQAGVELKILLKRQKMDEGKRLYQNYCIHCHGEKGQGTVPVVKKNKVQTAGIQFRIAEKSSGRKNVSYHTVWKNMMGSHASQLTPSQRWMIIMYVQTMQAPTGTAAVAVDSQKMPLRQKCNFNSTKPFTTFVTMDRKYELTKNNKNPHWS